MDLLIKGMEMPADGRTWCLVIGKDGEIRVPAGDGEFSVVEGAKAIPLPPHGDLIERDALYAVMKKERDRISEDYGDNDEYVQCFNKYAMSMVRSAPIIIPAEEGEE